MALIIYGLLQKDQYKSIDIYYPPWDKIKNYDGENGFLFENEVKSEEIIVKNIINDKETSDKDEELSDITDSDSDNENNI